MLRWDSGSKAIACAIFAAIAYLPSLTNAAANAPGFTGADTTAVPRIDCTKVYSQSDVSGLIVPPVKMTPFPGGVTWCNFGNDFSGDITVIVGSSESVEVLWDDAAQTSNRAKFVSLAGVGDEALFEAGTNAINPELASKKGRTYCIVTYDRGTVDHYKAFKGLGGAELGKRLGDLCNKAFVAVRA